MHRQYFVLNRVALKKGECFFFVLLFSYVIDQGLLLNGCLFKVNFSVIKCLLHIFKSVYSPNGLLHFDKLYQKTSSF